MIGDVLELIAREVSSKQSVVLNRANIQKGKLIPPINTISLSLLNIEEELSMRSTIVEKRVVKGKVYKKNPPLNINLRVMFISNFPDDYITELNAMTEVLAFFQRSSFILIDNKKINTKRVNFKLNSIDIDEQEKIWNLLGMEYLPSVIYTVSILVIEEDEVLDESRIVKTVDIQTDHKNR